MACFIVPAAEAVVTTIVKRAVKKKEVKTRTAESSAELSSDRARELTEQTCGVPLSEKLKWLNTMLWGGTALLAFEHVWHGEVTPWFPFLTAASNPAETAEMLHEMATSGVAMAVLVTAVWGVMAAVSGVIVKRSSGEQPAKAQTQEEA
ncbi:MAG: hypothetical protein LIO75_09195 [Lachnospiraceae bacterium]|nr:hypothetical protein [Lachnospiraceae bacterium]